MLLLLLLLLAAGCGRCELPHDAYGLPVFSVVDEVLTGPVDSLDMTPPPKPVREQAYRQPTCLPGKQACVGWLSVRTVRCVGCGCQVHVRAEDVEMKRGRIRPPRYPTTDPLDVREEGAAARGAAKPNPHAAGARGLSRRGGGWAAWGGMGFD